MSVPREKPSYVYKLVPHASPVPLDAASLPSALPVSPLDETSGFIHLSTALQVRGTLVHFFASDPRVYILRLAYAPLEAQKLIRWEGPQEAVCGPRPGEGAFPHLYNGLRIGKEEVDSVKVLEKGEGGWEEAMERDEELRAWLV